MDFYEVLDQVVALLKERERVTYRTLRRQFELDDEKLEDLKEELLYAHESAVQADDRGFTWTGRTETTSQPDSQPNQPESQPVVEQTQPTQVEPKPVDPQTPDAAERRQLTILFTDLVDSTKLSGQLDAEEYREVVRAYQGTCSEVIERFGCFIAQTLGDGLLIYSGYPVASERDAENAVRTGLGIVEAMTTLNERLERERGIRLSVRIGIHTGLCVIGEINAGERQEQLALGEVPNVAARIQGLAEPDTVVISSDTYRLVEGFFETESLGEHDLKGVAEPVVVYRALRESGAQTRLDIIGTRGLTPLVGRQSELQLLIDRWNQTKLGEGQVVLLNAEPGLGKSRMVQALREHLADASYTRLECRSSPYYQNTALYPIVDLIQRTLQWEADDTVDERLHKLELALSQYRLPIEETVPLMAGLLSLSLRDDRFPPLNLTPQRQRQKTLEIIVAMLVELAERQPVWFILEDLHWTDPSTLELLDLLVDQTPTFSIYILLTCRPEFQPTWGNRSYLTQITLNRLSRDGIEQVASQVAGEKSLPDEVLQQLVEKTDGVPLFVEEITKAVLESGLLKESDGQYELTGSIGSLTIPATLQDSLMSRLDRLVTAKAIAQYASVLGRQFSYELLQAVSELDEATLQRELGRLLDAELIYQRGLPPNAIYTFKHALVQDTAYGSLLRSTRQQYHAKTATVLASQFPNTAESQLELLAHHYTEAGMSEQAIEYWHQAGEKASEQFAYEEAIAHLTRGLNILERATHISERSRRELLMLSKLRLAFTSTFGLASVEVQQVNARIQTLCQGVEDIQQLLPLFVGLVRYHTNRGELQIGWEFGEQLLNRAQRTSESGPLILSHLMLASLLLWRGEIDTSRKHLQQVMRLYNPLEHQTLSSDYGNNPKVLCLAYDALSLWLLGFPEQSLLQSHESLSLARQIEDPSTHSLVLHFAARLHQFRREGGQTQERAEDSIRLITTHQLSRQSLAMATIFRGWALTNQEQAEEGLSQIQQGLDAYWSTGANLLSSYGLYLLAQALSKLGQVNEGLKSLNEGIIAVQEGGVGWWEAELHRFKGKLLAQNSSENAAEVETCFHKALDIARSQKAKSLELRAATSLARLWQSQGKREEAHDLLAPVYDWFTEGHDTADLKDAKALLGKLA